MSEFDSFEKFHKNSEIHEFSQAKITKKDLRKFAMINAIKMEEFIKEKGLYQEFYDKKIAPDIKFNISLEIFENATIQK